MVGSQGGPEWAGKRFFTTGEAARICGVSQQTIIRCFDDGRIRGYRVPGSRYRKIPREALIRFLEENDLDAGILGPGPVRTVVVVTADARVVAAARAALEDEGTVIAPAATDFEAGLLAARLLPEAFVIDADRPGGDWRDLTQQIAARPELNRPIVIVLDRAARAPATRAPGGADGRLPDAARLPDLLARIAGERAAGS